MIVVERQCDASPTPASLALMAWLRHQPEQLWLRGLCLRRKFCGARDTRSQLLVVELQHDAALAPVQTSSAMTDRLRLQLQGLRVHVQILMRTGSYTPKCLFDYSHFFNTNCMSIISVADSDHVGSGPYWSDTNIFYIAYFTQKLFPEEICPTIFFWSGYERF
jgi:hypothetical protein